MLWMPGGKHAAAAGDADVVGDARALAESRASGCICMAGFVIAEPWAPECLASSISSFAILLTASFSISITTVLTADVPGGLLDPDVLHMTMA
jgi:hypothetical protein